MSGFRYDPSPEEIAAAEMLRAKGWKVDQPRCPECNGWGHRTLFKAPEDYVVGEGITYTVPCSRGCPTPSMTYVLSQTASRPRPPLPPPVPTTHDRGPR